MDGFSLSTYRPLSVAENTALANLYRVPGWKLGDELSVTFIGEIAAVAQLIVMGYQLMGKGNDPVAQGLSRFLNVTDFLQGRLTDIDKRLTTVLQTISELEERLKGHIDAAFFKDNVSQMRGYVNNLQSYAANPTYFEKNLSAVIANRDALQVYISKVRDLCDGVYTAAFLLGPAMSLWAQTWTAVWRLQGADMKHTVWDDPIHAKHVNLYLDLFDLLPIIEKDFEYYRSISVQKRWLIYTFDITSGVFKDTGKDASGPEFYAEATQSFNNLFGVVQTFTNMGQTHFLFASPYKTGTSFGTLRLWKWASVDSGHFADPATVAAAAARHNFLSAKAGAYEQHKKILNDSKFWLEQVRLYCKAKPKLWGGTQDWPRNVIVVNELSFTVDIQFVVGDQANCDGLTTGVVEQIASGSAFTVLLEKPSVCIRARRASLSEWGDWSFQKPEDGQSLLMSTMSLVKNLGDIPEV